MSCSPITLHFSVTPVAVSAPRPLGPTKLHYRAPNEALHHLVRKRTPSLKRKFTLTWKRLTQATRPVERASFIPPGFTLIIRSAKIPEDTAFTDREGHVKQKLRRKLKRPYRVAA
ncbi:hypothetical protein FIBSPDRAFT_894895 [Athelia psychrophila]|uniref:Uncharacterized protein n=1 Tax=Athelia psychrophila TaxID=1759441 RepID=A0A166FAX6_9AGAM|nr:hypothetical protein FIBSPDRAFT_894895 [Fibularhizoctonia sp. CBS 109695]